MEFTMNCETTRDLLATIENACEAQRALLMKADGISQNVADALTTLARSLHEIKQKILFEAIKARMNRYLTAFADAERGKGDAAMFAELDALDGLFNELNVRKHFEEQRDIVASQPRFADHREMYDGDTDAETMAYNTASLIATACKSYLECYDKAETITDFDTLAVITHDLFVFARNERQYLKSIT
jgi:hypothetical protein